MASETLVPSSKPDTGPLSSSTLDISLPDPEICVICLDRISDKAIALPCRHDHFDFSCLGTWLQQHTLCPLCKGVVKAIRYSVSASGNDKVFHLPSQDVPRRAPEEIERRRQRHRRREDTLCPDAALSDSVNKSVLLRRYIYEHELYSFYVGCNKISGYRNITPSSFNSDDKLLSRARKWIRRELLVFDFLNPEATFLPNNRRRASNAEYLLEYIVAILQSVDLKGSGGQAEDLLKDYLGRRNAIIFLHELEAWLRSPYERIQDWDSNTQYTHSLSQIEGRNGAEFESKSPARLDSFEESLNVSESP